MELFILNMQSHKFNQNLSSIFGNNDKERHLSKAYSNNVMALAVSNSQRLAVDIEKMYYRSEATISYFFNEFSTFKIRSEFAGNDNDQEWFYKAWTAMESFLKLSGYGFRSNKNFELDIRNGRIIVSNETLGWIRYVTFSDYLVCICSASEIREESLYIKHLGWVDKEC